MKIFIGILLIVYASIATAQTYRCMKWTWYNVGSTQKTVCLKWEKR
jgi:hypothetical protein